MMTSGQGVGKAPAISLLNILKEEGIQALWVGSLLPRVARGTLQQAITRSMFDFVSRSLGGSDIFQR